jgi:hypothetical protein
VFDLVFCQFARKGNNFFLKRYQIYVFGFKDLVIKKFQGFLFIDKREEENMLDW